MDDELGPSRFDVSAERVVSPTWRYDFVCDGQCGGKADLRVAADGSIWAALLGGYIAVPRTPGASIDWYFAKSA